MAIEIDTIVQRAEQLWQQTPTAEQNPQPLDESDSKFFNEFLTEQFAAKLRKDHGNDWQARIRSGSLPLDDLRRSWIERHAVKADGSPCGEGEIVAGHVNKLALNLPDRDFFLEFEQKEPLYGKAQLSGVNITSQAQTVKFYPSVEGQS